MFRVGQFFKTIRTGQLYILANIGRCPMLIGDGYERGGHSFIEAFKVSNDDEWNLVTSNQPENFIAVDVNIEGLNIVPAWEV